jgi:hypothetical protein
VPVAGNEQSFSEKSIVSQEPVLLQVVLAYAAIFCKVFALAKRRKIKEEISAGFDLGPMGIGTIPIRMCGIGKSF